MTMQVPGQHNGLVYGLNLLAGAKLSFKVGSLEIINYLLIVIKQMSGKPVEDCRKINCSCLTLASIKGGTREIKDDVQRNN